MSLCPSNEIQRFDAKYVAYRGKSTDYSCSEVLIYKLGQHNTEVYGSNDPLEYTLQNNSVIYEVCKWGFSHILNVKGFIFY